MTLALSLVTLPTTRAADSDQGYFNLPVSESDPLRAIQVEELNNYIHFLQQDDSRLQALLQPDYQSPETYAESISAYRAAFARSIGYPPPRPLESAEADFVKLGADELGTYFRVSIPVLPGVQVQGIYTQPKENDRPVPFILALHGGGGSPERALFNGGGNYNDMVRGAAKRGYAVFAPQMLFLAEGYSREIRRETDERLRLVGTSITALEIFKHRRSLDVMLARPEIDSSRVGIVGLSYGGFYAMMTAAFEPRIKVVVSSCYYGVQEWRYDQDELSIPSDFVFFDRFTLFRDSELVALICPRPLLIQAGRLDRESHREKGLTLAPISAEYYQRLGLSERFEHLVFDGKHEFHNASAWDFVALHL